MVFFSFHSMMMIVMEIIPRGEKVVPARRNPPQEKMLVHLSDGTSVHQEKQTVLRLSKLSEEKHCGPMSISRVIFIVIFNYSIQ